MKMSLSNQRTSSNIPYNIKHILFCYRWLRLSLLTHYLPPPRLADLGHRLQAVSLRISEMLDSKRHPYLPQLPNDWLLPEHGKKEEVKSGILTRSSLWIGAKIQPATIPFRTWTSWLSAELEVNRNAGQNLVPEPTVQNKTEAITDAGEWDVGGGGCSSQSR